MLSKKIFIVSAFLAVAAFGLYGLNTLLNSRIDPVLASAPQTAPTPPSQSAPAQAQAVYAVEIVPATELPARAPDAAGFFSKREENTLTLQSSFISAEGAQFSVGDVSSSVVTTGSVPAAGLTISGLAVSGGSQDVTVSPLPAQPQVELNAEAISGQGIIVTVPDQAPELLQGGLVQNGMIVVSSDGGSNLSVSGPGALAQAVEQNILVTAATKFYRDATQLQEPPSSGTHTVQQKLEPGTLDDLAAQQSMLTVWGHLDGDQWVADVILYQNLPIMH